MVRTHRHETRSLATLLPVLATVVLLAACNGEPYELEGENPTGELPDQDVEAVEADRAFQGHPMEEPDEDLINASIEYCTDEEVEAHRKSVTDERNGRILDEGVICVKPKPTKTTKDAPAAPGATTR
jgi:hypothetical protein